MSGSSCSPSIPLRILAQNLEKKKEKFNYTLRMPENDAQCCLGTSSGCTAACAANDS
jgi:hypothetical protein